MQKQNELALLDKTSSKQDLPRSDHGINLYRSSYEHQRIASNFRYFTFSDMFKISKSINASPTPLDHRTLPPLYETFNSEPNIRGLDQIWYHKKEESSESQAKNPSLIRCLVQTHKTALLKNFILVFFQINTSLASALLLGKLMGAITSTSKNEDMDIESLVYHLLAFIICNFCSIIIENIANYDSAKLGRIVRMSILGFIYKKLNISTLSSVQGISIGKIVNLLSNDIKDLDLGLVYFSSVLLAPWSLFISCYVLWSYFGVYSIISLIIQTLIVMFAGYLSGRTENLRNEKNALTDQRIKYTNELIENIRLLKLYAWEKTFIDKISAIRDLEVGVLKKLARLTASSSMLTEGCTYICILSTSIAYALSGGILSPEKIYTTALVLGFTRFWIIFCFHTGYVLLVGAKLTCKRLEEIMNLNEVVQLGEDPVRDSLTMATDITFACYSAYWTPGKACLRNISLTIEGGNLVTVIGKVGSGKTTLLLSILKEVPTTTGHLLFRGSLAYVEQEPVIFSGSVRENILFGRAYDEGWYSEVLRACNITEDLQQFGHGDQTIVGDRGVTLSGGQKVRVSLARALYSRSDIYLLDDPLSAVDSRVGRIIFERGIRTMLRGKTVVLVTHHLNYAKEADKVILMDEGSVKSEGTFDEVLQMNQELLQLFASKVEKEEEKVSSQELEDRDVPVASEGLLMPEEEINLNEKKREVKQEEISVVNMMTYKRYVRASRSYTLVLSTVLVCLVCQFSSISFARYIGYWAQLQVDAYSLYLDLNQNQGILSGVDNAYYIQLGIFFTVAAVLCSFAKYYLVVSLILKANTNLHKEMLYKVSRTFVSFFDSTSVGTILNRFTNDVGTLDKDNCTILYEVIDQVISTVLLLSGLCYLNPLIIIPSLLVIIGLFRVKAFFARPVTELQATLVTTSSQLFSEISSTLHGLLIIRTYHQGARFIRNFLDLAYTTTKSFSMYLRANRLFSLCLQLLLYVLIVSSTSSFLYMAYLSKIEVALFGLALYYLMSIVGCSAWTIRQTIVLDMTMQNAERIQQYCLLPEEAPAEIPDVDAQIKATSSSSSPTAWPSQGRLSFHSIFLRYANTESYALNGLTFTVEPQRRVGIVGRTGAGKSSIIQALFRMVETESRMGSRIEIDGVNIKTLGLKTLRGSLSILPQSPVIFTGTIRRNLDPFDEKADSQIWEALEQVSLKAYVSSLEKGIDTDMTMSSSVFSTGQKQLVCLARVILKKSKVVVLDEATANVDMATDSFVQGKIGEVFKDCVVLTIAHRLSTIANYDKVLVMDKGVMVEYDHPYCLLVETVGDKEMTKRGGVFVEMVRNSGEKIAEEILKRAYEAYYK